MPPLNQLLEFREFAARQGGTVHREYTDEATAKNGERTGFKDVWADLAKRRFLVAGESCLDADSGAADGGSRRSPLGASLSAPVGVALLVWGAILLVFH